jgi:hypothetical protein
MVDGRRRYLCRTAAARLRSAGQSGIIRRAVGTAVVAFIVDLIIIVPPLAVAAIFILLLASSLSAGLETGFETSKPAATNVTLSTICKLCRTDSICRKISSRPFTVSAISTAAADGVPSRHAVSILAFAMSPFSGNLVGGRADSAASDRSAGTRH